MRKALLLLVLGLLIISPTIRAQKTPIEKKKGFSCLKYFYDFIRASRGGVTYGIELTLDKYLKDRNKKRRYQSLL